MDVYIRNELSVSSDLTLDQAATHSAKLLAWLLDCQQQMQRPQQKQLELSYEDVECMLKATLYLHECHARYGDELVGAVQLQFISAQSNVRDFYASCERNREQCIKELCASIVNGTRNGHTFAPLLYQLHKSLAAVQPAWEVIKELNWSAIVEDKGNETLDVATALELNADVQQMRQLVRRIFRLPNLQQMETALKRAMSVISYDLWLQLFREPKESILYTRCYLLRQMICDMLAEGVATTSSASANFVQQIHQFVSSGRSSNVARLWRSLLHMRFATSLGSYLLSYWSQQLPHLLLDDLQLAESAPLLDLPLEVVLYLTHLLLSPKSPCRQQFYVQLQTLSLVQRLLQLLNKVAYVYS